MAAKQETKTVRLRNVNSGAIVEVAEDKVARLGSEWEAATAATATAATRRTASTDKS
jgi:hypothetical protein